MGIPDFKPGQTFDFNRTFLTVDKEGDRIVIRTKKLNFVQRVIRTLFHWAGAYNNTFLSTKDITDIAKQEGLEPESIPKDKPLYEQILAIKRIVAEKNSRPLPVTGTPPSSNTPSSNSLASSTPSSSTPASSTLVTLKENVSGLVKNFSNSTSSEMNNCRSLLEKLDLDSVDVPTALLSLVAAGQQVLTAAGQASKEADAKSLADLAKGIGAVAQKTVHIAKKEVPVEVVTAVNKLAADVRVLLKTQNVVIVGKSRSGKTTLMNMVKDVCHVGGEMTMYYGTVKPELHKNSTQGWSFNTLDTPGWLETVDSTSGKEKRNNETIVDLIRTEVTNNFEGDAQDPFQNVDTFIFTFNIHDGIDPNEVACLKDFLDGLGEGKKKILAITRYENALENERDSCIDQLKDHKVMGGVLATHFADGANVLLSGCLDKSHFLDRSQTTRMEETLDQQSQALMTALLPESAKDRKEFLLNHSKANEARIKQFEVTGFEKEREELLLGPGEYAIDRVEEVLARVQKALVLGKLPQAKVAEFTRETRELESIVDEIDTMKELAEKDVSEAKESDTVAKAKALLDKITAQQTRFTQAKAKLDAFIQP